MCLFQGVTYTSDMHQSKNATRSQQEKHPKDHMFLPVTNRDRRLLPVKNAHPAYRLLFTDLTQIDLGGFQILMAQEYLGHDF